MKVSIIGSRGYPYVYSGYETFVKELVQRLRAKDVEVTVYCHKSLFKERPKIVNGVHLVYTPSFKSKVLSQPFNSFFSMIHACFSKTEVILVVNSANGPFGLIARIFRKKTVINVDGLEWLRPKWKGLGAKYFYFASWLATKFYDQIVNDSDEMRKVYLKLFNKDSVVIAYGANIRHTQNPSLIEKWNLKPNDYYLIVGRLIPDNNADLLIRGFLMSASQRRLVIVGDVPYKDKYTSSLKELEYSDKRLLFTGYVTDQDELAELYHQAYAYLHGHEFGGTNPTMLKAMAYGCCIMALDTPFNREMLDNGTYGVFFKKNAENLKSCIEEMENDRELNSAFKSKSREGIKEKYTWDYVTNKYLETFKFLVKESR